MDSTVSEYNKQDLVEMGYDCPISIAPILIPFEDYKQKPNEKVSKNIRMESRILYLSEGLCQTRSWKTS